MVQKSIKLRKDESFITLGVLLKITGIINTGGQAKFFLSENTVLVDKGEVEKVSLDEILPAVNALRKEL